MARFLRTVVKNIHKFTSKQWAILCELNNICFIYHFNIFWYNSYLSDNFCRLLSKCTHQELRSDKRICRAATRQVASCQLRGPAHTMTTDLIGHSWFSYYKVVMGRPPVRSTHWVNSPQYQWNGNGCQTGHPIPPVSSRSSCNRVCNCCFFMGYHSAYSRQKSTPPILHYTNFIPPDVLSLPRAETVHPFSPSRFISLSPKRFPCLWNRRKPRKNQRKNKKMHFFGLFWVQRGKFGDFFTLYKWTKTIFIMKTSVKYTTSTMPENQATFRTTCSAYADTFVSPRTMSVKPFSNL